MTKKILEATHDGDLKIGDFILPCAVLEDGTRVLTQAGFLKAIGKTGKSKGQTKLPDGSYPLPTFLRHKALKPFIDKEIVAPTDPIEFKPLHGGRTAYGYRAELLTDVCKTFLAARESGVLPPNQHHIAQKCEILMRGFAHVGIVALVDEATGYQYYRARRALEEILDNFIAKELGKWAKRFPDEFYTQMFRLRGWVYNEDRIKARPAIVGKWTNDLIYSRLAPGILEELKRKNPKDEKGRLKKHYHRWLTEDIGHPKLQEHLSAVTALMRISTNWRQFMGYMARALPRIKDAEQYIMTELYRS